jgi:hypothetical protein
MPKLRWLVAGFSSKRAGFVSQTVHVEFVVDSGIATSSFPSLSVFPSISFYL